MKIAQINNVIEGYFSLNKNISIIPAKDLMPYFIKAGIFMKDDKNGLPIRKLLRQLDAKNQLDEIPYVIAERKAVNTNWFFSNTKNTAVIPGEKTITRVKVKLPKETSRKGSDEHYIIDMCDELLGIQGSRQHRFSFLLGDAGTKLPVDAYYETQNLVVEFNELQHTKAVKHFDKPDKMTVSGVHRGEQRKIYDKRKRDVLPQHGISVIDIPYSAFECDNKGKIMRDKLKNKDMVRKHLANYLR
jgi:hypothetical protein